MNPTLKLTGQPGKHGKDYLAKYDCEEYWIERGNESGTFYLLRGKQYERLVDCKMAILTGAAKKPIGDSGNHDDDQDMAPEFKGVTPAAWLCLLLLKPHFILDSKIVSQIEIDLDKAGWVDIEQDAIDEAKVRREFKRCGLEVGLPWSKRSKPALATELEHVDFQSVKEL